MKLVLVKIGKPRTSEVRALVDMYLERMQTLAPITSVELRDGDKIPGIEKSGTHLVVLDERGKQWTSPDFAKLITKWTDDPAIKQVIFVIGGPYGVPEELRKSAQTLWALSAGVLPSDLAWLVTAEQIYRAYTILKGTSYHHQ